jgi:hypothetical protein
MADAIRAKQGSSCDLRLRRTESLPLCCATSPATTLSSLFFFFFFISCLPFFPFCSSRPSRARTKRSGQRNGGIIYPARRCTRLRCTSKVKVRYGRVKEPYSLSVESVAAFATIQCPLDSLFFWPLNIAKQKPHNCARLSSRRKEGEKESESVEVDVDHPLTSSVYCTVH